MNPRLAHLLVSLYPRSWKERYAAEFKELLKEHEGGFRTAADIIGSALWEHIVPTQGGNMDPNPNSFRTVLRHPSAFLPLAMSLTALSVVLVSLTADVMSHGHIVRPPDEGTAAHLWQLLMTIQVPIVVFFAIKWLRRAPGQTLGVLLLQAGAWLASCAPVFFLNL